MHSEKRKKGFTVLPRLATIQQIYVMCLTPWNERVNRTQQNGRQNIIAKYVCFLRKPFGTPSFNNVLVRQPLHVVQNLGHLKTFEFLLTAKQIMKCFGKVFREKRKYTNVDDFCPKLCVGFIDVKVALDRKQCLIGHREIVIVESKTVDAFMNQHFEPFFFSENKNIEIIGIRKTRIGVHEPERFPMRQNFTQR